MVSATPDLAVRLPLDPYAPRAARFHVREVDSPSPDLRDAVVLLTSEIVSRAVEGPPPAVDERIELLVWMPPEVVRVELRAPPGRLDVHEGLHPGHYDLMLLDCIADRWAIERLPDRACLWFEIDRGEGARELVGAQARSNNSTNRARL